MGSIKSRKIAIVCILTFQVILIILFSIFVKYDANADPLTPASQLNSTILDSQYPMFQDVHVMIFVGFGLLMTFLKKYAFSAIGITFLTAALVVQWGMLCQGFFDLDPVDERIHLSITSLINADIIAAAILISFGAVLGKISPIQLLVMAIIETVFFAVNEFLGVKIFQAVDAGGSVYVHTFGAYFGLAVSFVLARGVSTENEENKLEESTYQSDINSLIGTLFLWAFWPSFNAGLLSGDEKHRAVVNTYLAMTSSCVAVFAFSSMFNKNSKFDMMHVQNATMAGGVCVGTVANMMVQPYGALFIGTFAGALSTFGFRFVQEFLLKKLHIHDTCGVNNLHGMPGITAGIIGAIMSGMANQDTYGLRLFDVFPAMGPSTNRTPGQQAGFQLVGLVITLLLSILGGLMTGLAVRNFGKLDKKFDDEVLWNLPVEKEPPNSPAASVLVRKMLPDVSPKEYYNDETWWNVPETAEEKVVEIKTQQE